MAYPSRRARLSLESLESRLAPAVYTVTRLDEVLTPGSVNLYQAITSANANPGSDVIRFAFGGTISQNVFKLPIITDDVVIVGPPDRIKLTRDASQTIRLLNVGPTVSVSISRIDFVGGSISGVALPAGGAIGNDGILSLTDCRFSDNFAAQHGGAIANSRALRVSNCRFENNSAGEGVANYGGAIWNTDNAIAEIDSTTFINNHAGNSGAVYNDDNCILTVTNCLFQNNTALNAGALRNDGYAVVENSTFSGNTVSKQGGALVQHSTGSMSLTHVTITNNRCNVDGEGGAAGGFLIRAGGPVTLTACLIAGNYNGASPSTAPTDVLGEVETASQFNLIGSGKNLTGISNGTNSNKVGTQTSPLDPKLAPLADNGGPTWTHALLVDSPALDSGPTELFLTPPDYANRDQRGRPRKVAAPSDTANRPDIGAFEAQVKVAHMPDRVASMNSLPLVKVGLYSGSSAVVTTTSSNQAVVPLGTLTYSPTSDYLAVRSAANAHGTATITVTATSAVSGDQMTDTFVVTFTGITLAGNAIAENAGVNSVVGTLTATTAVAGTMTFALTGDAGGAFKVSGNQILVADTAKLDFEAGGSRSVTVQALVNGVVQLTQTFVVYITNVVEPPVNSVPVARLRVVKNTSFSFQGATRLTVAFADSSAKVVQTTLTVSTGRLFVKFPAGITVLNQNTSSVVIIGTRDGINAAIDQLRWTPAANFKGKATLKMTSVDKISTLFAVSTVNFDVV